MKNISLYIIGLALSVVSCDSFLTEEPKDFISPDLFFNTEQEVESSLLGVYDYLHNEQIGDFGWLFRGEGGADVAVNRNILRYNVYQYYQMESLPTQVLTSWRIHYKAIGDANMVINRTEKTDFNPDFKNQIIAEASFLRAYYYFQLTLMWGDVPLWTDEVTGDNLSEISSLPRSPRQEVYNQIIQDLSFASEVLPESRVDSELGRITKWAAKGLLAKAYLFNKQWENASKIAQEIINNSDRELLSDFSSIFEASNSWNKETLFVVPFMSDVKGSWLHTCVAPSGTWENIKHDYTQSQIVRPDGKIASKNTDFI